MDGMAAIIGAVTALVGALSVTLPLIARLWSQLNMLRSSTQKVWHGLVGRGTIEAIQCGLMTFDGHAKRWIVSQSAIEVLNHRVEDLRAVRKKLWEDLGREPSDDEFSWEVELNADLQKWMLQSVCPLLGINQYGCLVIAYHLVREATGPAILLAAFLPLCAKAAMA